MTNPSTNKQIYLDEIKGFFREVLACLKTLSLYPENHPAIGPSLEKTYKIIEGFLNVRGAVSFGIAEKEIILLGDHEDEDRIETQLAEKLHHRGILTLTLEPGIKEEEFSHFVSLLSKRQESSDTEERLDQVLEKAGVTRITMTFVDYRRIVEGEAVNLSGDRSSTDVWISLIQKAKGGDQHALQKMADCFYDSSLFHELNEQIRKNLSSLSLDEAAIDPAEILAEIHQNIFQDIFSSNEKKRTSPKSSSSDTEEPDMTDRPEEDPFSLFDFPDEVLLNVLASAMVQQGKVDTRISTAFQSLLQNPEKKEALQGMVEMYAQKDNSAGYSPQIWDQIRCLFFSGSEEPYMSDDYHQILHDLSHYHLEELKESITEENLKKVQKILHPKILKKTRQEILFYLIQNENQDSLLDGYPLELRTLFYEYACALNLNGIMTALKQVLEPPVPLSPEKKVKISEALFKPLKDSWVDQLIQEIGTIGEKELGLFQEIITYCTSGLPELLVHHLGHEGSISGRRRISSLLVDFGEQSLPAIVDSLDDDRWYLIRNLVMIVGKIGDPSIVSHLTPLLSHDHFRVQREVITSLSMIGGDDVVPPIRRILLNRSKKIEPSLQTAAAMALKRLGSQKSRKVLQEGLEDKDKKVQEVCCQVLKGLV